MNGLVTKSSTELTGCGGVVLGVVVRCEDVTSPTSTTGTLTCY